MSAKDKALFKSFGLSVLIYLVVVIGGSVLYMIVSTAVRGFIAYNAHTLPAETLAHPFCSFFQDVLPLLNFGFFFGVFGFLQIGAVCAGIALISSVYCKNPIVVRTIAGITTALASGFWTLGAVWYVVGHDEAVWIAMALGAITGAWLLPRNLPA